MLQRVQTIYLLGACIALVLLFFIPYGAVNLPEASSLLKVSDSVFLSAINGLGALLILITVFLYKQRITQIKMGRVCVGINLILMASLFFISSSGKPASASNSYSVGAVLPIVSLLFILLAIRGIRKDEDLVRSADRIR